MKYILTLFIALSPMPLALAQEHDHNLAASPVAVGQAGFEAIAEIVDLLQSDPDTNWSDVNIDALRNHLVDMNNLTVRSQSETTRGEAWVQFEIRAEGEAIASLQRMVNAHAPMLDAETGWTVTVENQPSGAILRIEAENEDLMRAEALGFYGLMTIGAHHQDHHLAIATGNSPH